MVFIKKTISTTEKLKILSRDSQYDLACACGTNKEDSRKRSEDNKWIYPVLMDSGRRTFLFKTLLSNKCGNNCKYCPLRVTRDPQRCTLEPEEIADYFLNYYRNRQVNGLFISSGVFGSPDNTMEHINKTAAILRKKQFKGYMHLKIIPGASDAAIEQAVSLASAVSINIEAPGEKNFKELSTGKDYMNDIIRPIKLVSKLTRKGSRYNRVKQTTQFVIGASNETDKDIVKYVWWLYKKLDLDRSYFSAYQRGLGDPGLPGENSNCSNSDILMREHRLYQADWLIRKYKFKEEDITFDETGNLSLEMDPKEAWAIRNPNMFPVNLNKADKYELLRVPGLGYITVDNILEQRKKGVSINSIFQLGILGKRIEKAQKYITF